MQANPTQSFCFTRKEKITRKVSSSEDICVSRGLEVGRSKVSWSVSQFSNQFHLPASPEAWPLAPSVPHSDGNDDNGGDDDDGIAYNDGGGGDDQIHQEALPET